MRRFALPLDDQTFDAFYKAFPGHGVRTAILRRCVLRLIQKAKEKGMLWETEVGDVVDSTIKW